MNLEKSQSDKMYRTNEVTAGKRHLQVEVGQLFSTYLGGPFYLCHRCLTISTALLISAGG